MQKLVKGVHNFQQDIFGSQREFFENLAKEQRPLALFITCSDSRINPNLITQTDPGELFILRNAGNIIPPYSPTGGGEAATIEFAITELGVRDVIVCGHTCCGAMKALISDDNLEKLPAVRTWLNHSEATRRIIRDNYSHLHGDALLTAAVEENVLVQLEHLRTHPCIASAILRRNVNLYGWVYKLETGDVFAFNPDEGQFIPLAQSGFKPLDTGQRTIARVI